MATESEGERVSCEVRIGWQRAGDGGKVHGVSDSKRFEGIAAWGDGRAVPAVSCTLWDTELCLWEKGTGPFSINLMI